MLYELRTLYCESLDIEIHTVFARSISTMELSIILIPPTLYVAVMIFSICYINGIKNLKRVIQH
jgi:hypothetical protein